MPRKRKTVKKSDQKSEDKKPKIKEAKDDFLMSGSMQPGVETLFEKTQMPTPAAQPVEELPDDIITEEPASIQGEYVSNIEVATINAAPTAPQVNQVAPAKKSTVARKYFAFDKSRISFWCKEIRDKQFVTEKGPALIPQESGFDCIIADLIMCSTDQLLECAPRGDIRLGNGGKVEDVKHYFYGLSLDKPLDKSYAELTPERKRAALSFFIHVLAAPKYMDDGSYKLCSPKGATKAGLGNLVETTFPGVAFMEVPIGTPSSYNPDDHPKPKRLAPIQQVGYTNSPTA